MSALSYLEESMVPICTTLPSELLGSTRTSLMPFASSKDSTDHLESGASSAVLSLMIASSSEVMITELCS